MYVMLQAHFLLFTSSYHSFMAVGTGVPVGEVSQGGETPRAHSKVPVDRGFDPSPRIGGVYGRSVFARQLSDDIPAHIKDDLLLGTLHCPLL